MADAIGLGSVDRLLHGTLDESDFPHGMEFGSRRGSRCSKLEFERGWRLVWACSRFSYGVWMEFAVEFVDRGA